MKEKGREGGRKRGSKACEREESVIVHPGNKCRLENISHRPRAEREEVCMVQGSYVSHWGQRMIVGWKWLDRGVDICRRQLLVW